MHHKGLRLVIMGLIGCGVAFLVALIACHLFELQGAPAAFTFVLSGGLAGNIVFRLTRD